VLTDEMITLNAASSPDELLGGNVETAVYDFGTLLKAEGWFARRRAAARLRLLKKLDARLARVLRAGERVRFVTKGSMASMAEQFFAGHAVAYHINLRALVFTTERVILIHIGALSKPRALVSELPYASIRKLRSTWSGFCEVTLANGRTHRFSGVPRADRKFLREFLATVIPVTTPAGELGEASDGLVHLCPHCYTALPGRPRVCVSCGGGIKAALTAALLSFGLPGLGNWYLGHRWFAVFEMIGAAMLWVVFVIRPLREELSHMDGEPLSVSFWAFFIGMVAVIHVVDAVVTYNFGRKGHHPGRAPNGKLKTG
jgi:hypothetical protein